MNAAKPTETAVPTDAKPSRTARIKQRFTNSDTSSEPKTLRSKAKTVAAGVGVVAIAAVAYASVAKRKSINVEVTAPAVDITTESA